MRPPTVGRKSANPFVVKQNFTAPQTIDQEFNKANRKILMLFGAPGTGKSTLAKVLATQVGYEIREVNASDKRNGEELINEIKNAMTTNAHFNRSGFDKSDSDQKKPVCLILDEIDGALGGGPDQNKGMGLVADFLKKCIRDTEWGKRAESKLDDLKRRAAEDADMDDGDGSDKDEEEKKAQDWANKTSLKNRANRDKFPPLSRPIIMVCNDGYAKALYPLRDIVLKLRVPGTGKDRLDERMQEILRQEGIRDFSNSVRTQIIEQSFGDARSAITRI